jgi:allantoinase
MLTQTNRYPYSPIEEREPLRMPNDARVAVVLYLNAEHFPENIPGTAIVPAMAKFSPDPLNYGWRDYGQRVGFWRLAKMFDSIGARASVLLNADICREYPQMIEAGNQRGWEWLGHGHNNSSFLNGLSIEEERKTIVDVIATIAKSTGQSPKGWLGPFMSETFNTPDLLAEAGIEYLCDFCCDDEPFPMTVNGERSLLSVPYTVECNDLPSVLSFGITGDGFGQLVRDQFDVLYAEGADRPRVMPICLHTFIAGQPFRAKHLASALKYIAGHQGVWFATAGEINSWYRENYQDRIAKSRTQSATAA